MRREDRHKFGKDENVNQEYSTNHSTIGSSNNGSILILGHVTP